MNITLTAVDYHNPKHATDLVTLLDGYAQDPMGGSTGLAKSVKANLVTELAKRVDAFSVLCYVDDIPAGLINCFEGFSTFKCKPIANIHDVTVATNFRGRGLSVLMMEKVEQIARARHCCKITLEVLEGNQIAQNAYLKVGFKGYELDPKMGKAMFWEKML